MTVRAQDGQIILEGRCRVEDAETLLAALQEQPHALVQLDTAETIHSAVIQVLLAAKPRLKGLVKHRFLREFGVLKDDQDEPGSHATHEAPT